MFPVRSLVSCFTVFQLWLIKNEMNHIMKSCSDFIWSGFQTIMKMIPSCDLWPPGSSGQWGRMCVSQTEAPSETLRHVEGSGQVLSEHRVCVRVCLHTETKGNDPETQRDPSASTSLLPNKQALIHLDTFHQFSFYILVVLNKFSFLHNLNISSSRALRTTDQPQH